MEAGAGDLGYVGLREGADSDGDERGRSAHPTTASGLVEGAFSGESNAGPQTSTPRMLQARSLPCEALSLT